MGYHHLFQYHRPSIAIEHLILSRTDTLIFNPMYIIRYIFLLIAFGTAITLAILLYKNKNKPNKGLIIFTISLGGLSTLYSISLINITLITRGLLGFVFFFMMCASAGYFILALEYTKRLHYLDIVNIGFLFILPATIQILIWSDAWHGLFWEPYQYGNTSVSTPRILWSWLIDIYVISLLMASSMIMLRLFLQGSLPYQKQSGILLAGTQMTIFIFILGILSNSITPDLSVFLLGFTTLGMTIAYCYNNYRLFSTVPISRDLIIDRNPDGIVVLDSENRIVDINPAAEAIINIPRSEVYGQPAEIILSNWEILTQNQGAKKMDFIGTMNVNNESIYYSVWIAPLVDHRGKMIGSIITWRDITERKRNEEAQQRARDEMFILMQAISGAASDSSDPRDFLTSSLFSVVYTFDSQVGFIFFLEKSNYSDFRISTVSTHGLAKESIDDLISLLESENLFSQIFTHQEHLIISEETCDAKVNHVLQKLGIFSLLITPMKSDKDIIGVIGLGRTEEKQFSYHDVKRLNVTADEIAALIISERHRQLRIALTERKRLIQDLHDSITERLYGLIMMTEVARIAAKSGAINKIPKMITQIEEHARHALKEMRLFLFEITPLDLKREGLVAVITRRLASVEGRADVDARLLTEGKISLSLEKQVAFYYIIQEALNNALRHARAKVVTVHLTAKRKKVTLEVYDDGVGFSPRTVASGGMGLVNMRERANQIGAKLKIISTPGKGTTIRVIADMDKFIPQEIAGA